MRATANMTPRAPLNPSFEATRAAEVNAFGQQIARREEKMREADAVRLKEADTIADDLRKQLDTARGEVLAAQELSLIHI